MKPPIASPTLEKAPSDVALFVDEAPLSVGPYRTSFWASARLAIKALYLGPAAWIMTFGFPMIVMLPFVYTVKNGATMAVFVVLYLLHVVGFAVLTWPLLVALSWFLNRNANETITTLSLQNALDVSKIRTIEISWRDVRRARKWRGDVFILGLRKGIIVPREAFASSTKGEEFIALAKVLKQNAAAK